MVRPKCRPFTRRSAGIPLFAAMVLLIDLIYVAKQIPTELETSSGSNNFGEPRISVPPVVTLHYGLNFDKFNVEHNCVLAKEAAVDMTVATLNTSHRYCSACRCVQFELSHCPLPKPNIRRNNCEKLVFISHMLEVLGELIYFDSDLLVLKPELFVRFAWRSKAHDFIAPYNEASYKSKPEYQAIFNSGLFFMRKVHGVNNTDLVPYMYRIKSGSDQSVLTYFVHRFYKNWDTLSISWHCRAILRFQIAIEPENCLALHDRNEQWNILERLKYKLRSIESMQKTDSRQ